MVTTANDLSPPVVAKIVVTLPTCSTFLAILRTFYRSTLPPQIFIGLA